MFTETITLDHEGGIATQTTELRCLGVLLYRRVQQWPA